MKTVISGNGTDSTAAVRAYLQNGDEFRFANLILIGRPEDPRSYWLTDYEAPLNWPVWGTFRPGVITRGTINSKIGLEVTDLTLEWSPPSIAFTNNTKTTNAYQLALIGFFDNWEVRVWRAFMPTPGDVNTYGACELFGGRISGVSVQRGKITFTVTSFLDVVNQMFPTNLIELTNSAAPYRGTTLPPGQSSIPQFNVIAGSTQTNLILDEVSPSAHHIFADNALRGGWVQFNRGSSDNNPLGGVWAAIYANRLKTISSVNYNEVILYQALPWSPVPGSDTAWISGPSPIDAPAPGGVPNGFFGFPWTPAPSVAV